MGLIKIDITDHFPIFVLKPLNGVSYTNKSEFIEKRSFTDNNIGLFKEDLAKTNWDIFHIQDPEIA